jgi:tetratricopeptide (TPR) repeat protein
MFTTKGFHAILAFGFVCCTLFSSLHAQSDSQVSLLKSEAIKEFSDGNFREALSKYEALIQKFPKDASFHYYKGLCLLNMNYQLPKAIECLEFANSRPNIPVDGLYYQGLAYLKTYQFPKAKASFESFMRAASRQDARKYEVAMRLKNVENAMRFTETYNPYEVYSFSNRTVHELAEKGILNTPGGRFDLKPAEFFMNGEEEDQLTNYFFMPKSIIKGEYVYISAYNKTKKGGAELFRVRYNNGKSWGKPEPLISLNTLHDEILPYFDPVSKDLYFASNGHNSMGGFDLFKSRYDEERNTFSEPLNLGFPVNSPYDELLFIPGVDLGSVFLLTERQSTDSLYSMFKIRFKDPVTKITTASSAEKEKIGRFGDDLSAFTSPVKVENTKADKSPKIEEKAKAVEKKELESSPYQDYLRQALMYQFKADSLSRLALDARNITKDINDPDQRWAMQKKIIEDEKGARDFQVLADNYYAKIKAIEASDKAVKQIPPTIQADTILSGFTVYKFTGKEAEETNENRPVKDTLEAITPAESKQKVLEGEPGDPPPAAPNGSPADSRFLILDKSPYSVNNPIPVDLPLPSGPFYQIQLGVFSQKVSPEHFGGISPISGETIQGKNMTRYYAGKFNRYTEASKALESLKKKGFNDAFIVSWFDGQKVPVAKVKELEEGD